jgi:Cellulase (glycosyl hydrolase family 5)
MGCSASTSARPESHPRIEVFMPRIRILFCVLTACSALGLGASPASASHGQALFFEGSADLLNPKTRDHALTQLQALGVRALRVELYWYSVAPSSTSAAKPSFEATNPGSYNWGQYDILLAEAKRLGWQVLLTVTAPVPRWATANHKAPYTYRPDTLDFQEFMTAVARHYGSEVSLYSIWNEPNEPVFLTPQWSSSGKPVSGRIYRGLYEAAYAGLQAAGLTHPRVLFGETAPVGYDTVNVRREKSKALLHPVAPLAFMREALCLNAKYRKSGSCSELQMSGYAHHAYFPAAGPKYVWPQKDSVTIGSLSRLSNALNLATRAHAITGGAPMYLTEFGVNSQPNKFEGVSAAKQAEYDAIAEHIAYSNPRVAAFSQYLLRDDPLGGPFSVSAIGGFVGFQTGLEYVNTTRKPLYYGFSVPLTVTKRGHGFSLWGLVRPTTGATSVTVLVQGKRSNRLRVLKTVRTDSRGYWSFHSNTAGATWRVRWKSASDAVYSGPPIRAY